MGEERDFRAQKGKAADTIAWLVLSIQYNSLEENAGIREDARIISESGEYVPALML